ncbi:MAG: hypothetical protein ACRC7N_21565 [Clostridium sp.]
MKVALINGSPRGKNSSSLALLNGLKEYLLQEELATLELMWNTPSCEEKDFSNLLKCNAIVFAFPLYIDSIPSHLLRNLVSFEEYIKKNNSNTKGIKIYVILNNGFFDGKQNCLAIESMGHFSKSCGFEFIEGIGLGGGGMIPSVKGVPFGHGPKKGIGMELKRMASDIKSGSGSGNVFVEMNFPGFLYKLSAEFGWRMQLRKNGLRFRDIGLRR